MLVDIIFLNRFLSLRKFYTTTKT